MLSSYIRYFMDYLRFSKCIFFSWIRKWVTFYLCYKNYKNILINKIDWNIYIGSCREIRFSSEIRIHPFGCYKYCCLVSISYLGFCSRMDLFCSLGTTRFAQFSFPIESSRISRIFDKAYSRFDKYVLY